jgi:hypothetical protein
LAPQALVHHLDKSWYLPCGRLTVGFGGCAIVPRFCNGGGAGVSAHRQHEHEQLLERQRLLPFRAAGKAVLAPVLSRLAATITLIVTCGVKNSRASTSLRAGAGGCFQTPAWPDRRRRILFSRQLPAASGSLLRLTHTTAPPVASQRTIATSASGLGLASVDCPAAE